MNEKLLADIVDIDPQEFIEIAQRVIRNTRKEVRKNKYFRSSGRYTKDYADRKAARKAAPKGVGQASSSVSPDLTLTGKLLDSFNIIGIAPEGIVIGWDSYESKKIAGNAKHGRNLVPKDGGIILPVSKKLDADMTKLLKKKTKKIKNVTDCKLNI